MKGLEASVAFREWKGLRMMIAALAGCLLLSACGAGGPSAPQALTPSPWITSTPRPTITPFPDIPEPERPLLMAHFMPWYQTPVVSGVWGWHWTMNHFQPSRQDEAGRREIASYLYPLTGPYDSADAGVLEYQVLLMWLSGIDGVIVDWYGIEDFRDYASLDAATHALFEWVARAGLRFAICYEDQTVKHMVDNGHLPRADALSHGKEVMRELEARWFGTEAYLKVLDHPVLFVFGPQYFGAVSDWDRLFSVLEVRPALIALDGHSESAGLSSYPWPPMWLSRNGVLSPDVLESYLKGFYAKAAGWDYQVAGAFPGFHDIYEEAGVGAETRFLDPQEGETLRLTLELAMAQNPDVIQLITWNDYGETTTLEPTEETGYRYLEMVQEARRSSDPAGFPFTAEDLRLPMQLFELRQVHRGDAAANERLDVIFELLIAGDVAGARARLSEFSAP